MKSGFRSLVLASVLASAGFVAFAQTAPQDTARTPTAGASGAMQHDGHKGMRGHRMDPAKREAMVAKRQAELKAKLKLTAEQEGAWTTFTTAMKPTTRMDHKRPDRAEMEKLSTPERIDKMRALRAQHMADMNVAMDKRADATKAFYATLNADQKKVFDAEHIRMGHRHHGEHHAVGDKKGGEKPATK